MGTIVLDFETVYDKEYSLSEMPTLQYIRDPRFKILGCGFKLDENEEPFFVENPDEVLKKIDWTDTIAVAFNAQFDGAILYEKYRIRPRFWLDPMFMARWAIAQGHLSPDQDVNLKSLARIVGGEKGDTRAAVDTGGKALAEYCIQDIRLTWDLLQYLYSLKPNPPAEELAYMDLHIRMATEPAFCLDKPLLREAAIITPSDEAVHKILRKDENLIKIFEKLGVEVEYKTTPSGRKKPAFAKTDDFMQGLLNHDNLDVAKYASLRLSASSNIMRTRAQRFLDVGERFPMPLLYYGSHTGRSSGRDQLNVQNLPVKGPLRRALLAPPGCSIVVGDSKQVEARTIGWLAGDQALLDTFKTTDPYRTFGAKFIYHRGPEDLVPEQRKVAKSAVLGLGFGQGAAGFIRYCARNGIKIDENTACKAVDGYRGGFPKVPLFWRSCEQTVREFGYLTLPSGRKLTYPGLREEAGELFFNRHLIFSKGKKGERQEIKLWHGVLAENITQATARDVVFWQALQFAREGWRVVHLVHDEIVAIVPDDDARRGADRLLYWLRRVPSWADGLPVDGEVGIGKRYSDCK